MKYYFLTAVMLVTLRVAVGQEQKRTIVDPEGTATFVETKSTQRARLTFTTKVFEPSHHRISRSKTCTIIDGRKPLGTDCGLPKVEITVMKFSWNGKQIPIPRRFYSDCYQPPFFKDYQTRGVMKNYLAIKFSDDMKAVFVFLHGGDGAGVYDVVWVLRRDGNHARFTDSGGDCSFLNFDFRGTP
jgi:hypothetical protein